MFGLEMWEVGLAAGITLFAGFVKGVSGFAMPLIMMSAFGAFLAPHVALAMLILPTFTTNIAQALRDGPAEAWQSVRKYRLHIGMLLVFLLISSQFVDRIPAAVLYGLLGVPITAFALWQLAGRSLAMPIRHRRRAEAVLGAIGGLYGGISGIWGPPLIVYLVSIGADKRETVRVQGVVFLIGAAVLLAAHLQTGILDRQTLPLSALMTVPAALGMGMGQRLHDRLDAARFRRWTLVLLCLTGLNLLARALA